MRDDFDGLNIHIVTDSDNDCIAHFVELPNISACGRTVMPDLLLF